MWDSFSCTACFLCIKDCVDTLNTYSCLILTTKSCDVIPTLYMWKLVTYVNLFSELLT